MTAADHALRSAVAKQLDGLAAAGGPLSATGGRATAFFPEFFDASGAPSTRRRREHRDIARRYLARQTDVPRQGRAALLTAGPPGAGKTTTLESLTNVSRWRLVGRLRVYWAVLHKASGAL